MRCLLCEATHWKYNTPDHYAQEHPGEAIPEIFLIGKEERQALGIGSKRTAAAVEPDDPRSRRIEVAEGKRKRAEAYRPGV